MEQMGDLKGKLVSEGKTKLSSEMFCLYGTQEQL